MTECILSAIVKLFYARRNPDATQKKQILSASATIADIMVEHLKYEVEGINVPQKVDCLLTVTFVGDRVCCLDYHSVMLGLATILVVDGMYSLLLLSYSN